MKVGLQGQQSGKTARKILNWEQVSGSSRAECLRRSRKGDVDLGLVYNVDL